MATASAPTWPSSCAGGLSDGTWPTVAERVADWVADGSLPLPGAEPPGDGHVFFWRILGRMLTNGVPLPSALRALERETQREDLKRAASAMLEDLLKGHTLGGDDAQPSRTSSPPR